MANNTVDYGPLAGLSGTWKGDKGMDIAPDPDGTEENPFSETIVFTQAGDVTNAEEQTLAVVHYVLSVTRTTDNAAIHHQTGYWLWDKAKDEVVHSIAIPRAVCVLAVGKATTDNDGKVTIVVSTDESGVVQTDFMHKKAKTTSFKNTLTLHDGQLHYAETTMVDIYGNSFEHTDTNTLQRV